MGWISGSASTFFPRGMVDALLLIHLTGLVIQRQAVRTAHPIEPSYRLGLAGIQPWRVDIDPASFIREPVRAERIEAQ